MEMNWITALLGLIIVALCALPFVMMHYHWAKKEKKMLQSLQEIAQRHHSSIDQHEFCGNFVMGINKSNNFLFFFKQKKEEEIAQFVNLAEMKTCQVIKKTRDSANSSGLYSIQRLELSFLPSNKSTPEARLELYDEGSSIQLGEELQFATKWVKQINERLSHQ